MDGGRIVYLVDIGKIQDLRFPTFHFEPTAHGKFMLNIAFCQSKYYVDNLSENIRRGPRQKLRNGVWPNRPPVGYVNDRNTRSITVDPKKAPLVRKAFELYATGNHPFHEVRRRINGLGLLSCTDKIMSTSNFQHTLKNPFYCGLMFFNGELYEGKHDPIISKRLFDEVQAVMERKSKPKTPTLKPYLYRGVFTCGECGCFITTETQKGRNYLRCTKRVSACTQKYVREETIAEQIDREITKVALEAALADWMVSELENTREETARAEAAAIEKTTEEIGQIEKKIDILLDMRLSEQIGEQEYVSKKHVLLNRKAELKGVLEAFRDNRRNRFEPAIAFVKEAKDATILLAEGNPEKKRDFLRKIGSNLKVSEKRLSVEFKNPWNIVAEFNSAQVQHTAACGENLKISKWRREGDSNPRYFLGTHAFQACALNHSAISPSIYLQALR